jgi:hypothetical protein
MNQITSMTIQNFINDLQLEHTNIFNLVKNESENDAVYLKQMQLLSVLITNLLKLKKLRSDQSNL